MKHMMFIAIGLLAMVSMTGTTWADEPYQVGEKWVYAHEGMVPMRAPDYAISGDRVREVLSVEGEGDEQRWLIQEQWGSNDDRAGKRYVNADRAYDKIVAGDWNTTVSPAFPFDLVSLEADEEMTQKSTFQFGDFSFPIQLVAKRVADETIEVPAGTYENCTHIESKETVTFTNQNGEERNIVTVRHQWFHPSVNGLVKETFTREGSGQAEEGISELKEYVAGKSE